MKRSTGIPRSLQTKVEKPDSLALDDPNEDLRNTGVMVNADGDFVIAKPDKAAWELYQEKAKASAAAAAEAAAAENSKELQTRGLECPIDKRMFLEPTKAPCCQRTYCNDCITNALIESDFVCPGCGAEGVLLDNLSVDEDAVARIKTYEAEKAESKKEKDKHAANQDGHPGSEDDEASKAVSQAANQDPKSPANETASMHSKKRPLEESSASSEPRDSALASSTKKQKAEHEKPSTEPRDIQDNTSPTGFPPAPLLGPGFMQSHGMPTMPLPDSGFMNDGIGLMNSMMLPSASNLSNSNMNHVWNPMNIMNFNPLQNGMYGNPVSSPIPNGYGMPNMYSGAGELPMNVLSMGQMTGPIQQSSGFDQGPMAGHFANQQRTAFSTPFAREEDTAYFRQPVNPQRHQAKHRRIRPSDYREL